MQFTFLNISACVLIAGALGFMLFAPAGTIGKVMNAVGGVIQGAVAKIKSLL